MMPTMSEFPQPLIDARALAAALDGDRPPVVLDTSFDLADVDAGARLYAQGHIPGAYYAHLDRDLSTQKTGRNGRHPLPPREVFAAMVARWGIASASRVAVYDRSAGMFAARAWWMLRWLGHRNVSVLDGGFAAWLAEGLPQEMQVPRLHTEVTPYRLADATHEAMPTTDAASLLDGLGAIRLIDARAAERFRGEVEPLDPVAGHIPGARNRPFQRNLDAEGRFLAATALRSEFRSLIGSASPAEVVHQCGSGVTACHNLLAMEIAGLCGSRLYAGSWSEWCADAKWPVATD
jgi:thiosulfate/3-mercaptopyruvate sulfurtransferase